MPEPDTRDYFLLPSDLTPETKCIEITVPNDVEHLRIIRGLFDELGREASWQPDDSGSEYVIAQYYRNLNASNFPTWDESGCGVPSRIIGAVFAYAGATAPEGCLPCDGSTYTEDDYPALYAAISPVFINPTEHTFSTPLLGGRTIIGANEAYDFNEAGGAASVTLNTTQMPSHKHSLELRSNASAASGNGAARGNTLSGIFTETTNFGDGEPHNNMQPYLALNYYIVAEA